MNILAIETSCDETAVAIVKDGQQVFANVIASQIAKHAITGGVVPEVASREHMKVIMPVLKQAFEEARQTHADFGWNDIDTIAVTKEPGLIGSLIVGRMTAAALAFAKDKPLIEVNHVHGHMYSNWLGIDEKPEFPLLILTVSGGHNELVLMRGHGDFQILGETVDDAAGEAFDKTARLLGLGYPGGPAIEKAAKNGNPKAVDFPRSKMSDPYAFSFSGLKTAVLYYLQKNTDKLEESFESPSNGVSPFIADVAASFQAAALDNLVTKLVNALEEYEVKEVHLAGGVSANKCLRAKITEALKGHDIIFRHPQKMSYCTDNAAMIGAAAYWTCPNLEKGV